MQAWVKDAAGKDVAEEPEDVAVILSSSKRHWTTFNTAKP